MHSSQLHAHEDMLDNKGNTVLHIAAKEEDAITFATIFVRMLLNNEDAFKKNDQGKTAFRLIPASLLTTFEEALYQHVLTEYQSASPATQAVMKELGRKLFEHALSSRRADLALTLIQYQSTAINKQDTEFYTQQLYNTLKKPVKNEDKDKFEAIALCLIQLGADTNYIYQKTRRLTSDAPKKPKSIFSRFKKPKKSSLLTMKNLLEISNKPETTYSIRRPLLNAAIKNGYYGVADKLLAKDVDVNCANEYGNTALHTVARINNPVLFFEILKRADVRLENNAGLTALGAIQEHDTLDAYNKHYYSLILSVTAELQTLQKTPRYSQLTGFSRFYDRNFNHHSWFMETLTNSNKIEQLKKQRERLLATLTDDKNDNTELDLTGSLLSSPNLRYLLSSWQHSFLYLNLRSLNLSNTHIGYHEIKQLGEFLTFYRELEVLTLNANQLGGVHAKESLFTKKESAIQLLSQALYGYRSLQRLDLDALGLDDQDAEPLQTMMDSFDTFVHLSFADNPQLTGKYREKLEASLQHAQGRAELLGQPLPFSAAGKWKNIMGNLANHFSVPQERHDDKGKEKESDSIDKNETVSWDQLYELSKEIINEFLPSSKRSYFLKTKMANEESFNSFEELQLCAIDANAKLKAMHSTRDLSALLDIFANFIFFRKLDIFLTTELTTSNLFEEWLQICQSSKADMEFEQANKEKRSGETATQENERLFKIGFKKKLEQFWSASKVIQSGLIDVSNPLTKREKIYSFAGKLLIASIRIFAATTDLGEVIGKELSSHFSQEWLEETNKELEKTRLNELKQIVESGEISELTEELPWLGYYLFQLSSTPRKSFKAITGYSYLNTDERIRNFNLTFDNNEDFKDKIEALAAEILWVYQKQFKKLTPKAAWLLGQACGQHLQRGLMLGLFNSRTIDSLTLRDFIADTMQWFCYLPMDNPPKLTLKKLGVISADQFLRGPGLRCQQENAKFNGDLYFYWDNSMIEALKPYCFYQYQTTFSYQPDPHLLGCRIASEKEVSHLRESLSHHELAAQQNILLGNASMPIACLTWKLNDAQIVVLQETTIDTVTPIIGPAYIPESQRIAKLEQELADMKNTIGSLVRQETEKSIQPLRKEIDVLKKENEALKNKDAEKERKKNSSKPGLF